MTKKTKNDLIIENFNLKYPVGTDVTVKKDNGEIIHTKTRSEADLLGGHTPVIWLDGISGCYALSRVTPKSSAMEKAFEAVAAMPEDV